MEKQTPGPDSIPQKSIIMSSICPWACTKASCLEYVSKNNVAETQSQTPNRPLYHQTFTTPIAGIHAQSPEHQQQCGFTNKPSQMTVTSQYFPTSLTRSALFYLYLNQSVPDLQQHYPISRSASQMLTTTALVFGVCLTDDYVLTLSEH